MTIEIKPMRYAFLLGLIGAGAAEVARPHDALLAPELQALCRAFIEEPASTEGALCLTYVQGFLDGAVSIDARVRPAKEPQQESWIERAQRTRLGPEQLGAPPYCLNDGEPLQQIIDRLVTYAAERTPDPSLEARDYMALALRRFYPC